MYQEKILKNKAKLILVPIKNRETITVLFLFPVGSRYEQGRLNGISHFIEHMMFRGTKKRPTPLDITRQLDQIGAQYNAFTGKDQTGYWIKTTNKKMGVALDILSEMVFNSLLREEDVEKEKGVIEEEIKMYEENPLLFYDDLFEENFYQNHPLGQLISGSKENIRKITSLDIKTYWQKFYQPNQMTIVIAGGINLSKAKKLTESYLSCFSKKGKKNKYLPFPQNKLSPGPRVNILYKNLTQAQIALGGGAYPYRHPQLEALVLLMIILGGNMSSRLFREVREKRGLAYSVQARNYCYQDVGHYLISAGVDKGKIKETLKVILNELTKIKEKGITDQEFKMAQDYIIGSTKLNLEDSAHLANFYGQQALLIGKIRTPREKLQAIKKITKQEVIKVAQNIFQNLNLTVIGPFKEKSNLLRILSKRV